MNVVRACAALLLAILALAVPAAANGAGVLSPRLAELSRPAVRGLAPAQQARRLDLPASGPASLMRRGNRVVAEIRFEQGAAAAAADLRADGAEVLDVSPRYQTVTVAAAPADLPVLASDGGVAAVTEVLNPIVRGVDCGGLVRSEGDSQLNVANARSHWGVDGSGVTVGILSDSFDGDGSAATHAGDDVRNGDLPGPGSPCGSQQPVNVFNDPDPEGGDEGRGMAQIVHDLAPGATIDFATAQGGQPAFANSIKGLTAAGAKVLVDDAIYLDEPFFQDGPVAVAINNATAGGATYFTAAGNDNIASGANDVASFEAQFSSAGSCPAGVPGTACADFNPSPGQVDNAYDLEVAPEEEVVLDLQWAEPWGGVQTNLDAYLVDGSGTVLADSTNFNVSMQRPFEAFEWTNESPVPVTVKLAIPRAFGSGNPRFKFIQVGNGASGVVPTPQQLLASSGDTIGPTIFGHSGADSAISVGAISIGSSTKPERYSSRGPVLHFFGPVTGTTPAAPTGEVVLSKPDLIASDCGVTSFFAFELAGLWRFCGTSAAAPHAAAVAALMAQANPGVSPAQIRAALLASGRPIGSFGPNAIGAGLPDADIAVNSVALPPTITIGKAPAALGRERRPTIEFSANRPVTFACSLDGSVARPCTSPYQVPSRLGDGRHGIVVTGTDLGGRAGASPLVSFTVDTRAPRTKIVKHPPKLVRTRRARAEAIFRFHSSERGAKFVCKVDRGLRKFCGTRLVLRAAEGRHKVLVKAVDAAGNVDPSPAVFRFRVERVG
jgi:hypothetical protein